MSRRPDCPTLRSIVSQHVYETLDTYGLRIENDGFMRAVEADVLSRLGEILSKEYSATELLKRITQKASPASTIVSTSKKKSSKAITSSEPQLNLTSE